MHSGYLFIPYSSFLTYMIRNNSKKVSKHRAQQNCLEISQGMASFSEIFNCDESCYYKPKNYPCVYILRLN